MEREQLIRLIWQGHETITAIPELLKVAFQIEITLPADYNHALFRALNPEASTADLENIDAKDGPELLAEIAKVNGLEELAKLTDVISDAQASVHIVSPPKLVITMPSVQADL